MKRAHRSQLRLAIRLYAVRTENFEAVIQAGTPAAAKYELYKRAREAGYFKEGFKQFLDRQPVVVELRR